MEKMYLEDPQKITFASLGDRDQRFKKSFGGYRREKRQYRDFDEPEGEKVKTSSGNKSMVNFLDI